MIDTEEFTRQRDERWAYFQTLFVYPSDAEKLFEILYDCRGFVLAWNGPHPIPDEDDVNKMVARLEEFVGETYPRVEVDKERKVVI